MTRVFIVGYNQSKFGKLMDMSLERMLSNAAMPLLERAGATPEVVDTVSMAGLCTTMLNDQSLLGGLMAMAPGFAGKPIDGAENACASGGQAIYNVVTRMRAGVADVGIAVGVEKMRDNEGKMDGKLIGRVLGTASHPDQRTGKVFVFPHIFAEIMAKYMKEHGVQEETLAHVPVVAYGNANHNPLAQMHKVKVTHADVMKIEGIPGPHDHPQVGAFEERIPLGHMPQYVRLNNVCAGIDKIGINFLHAWFFKKFFYPAVFINRDKPVCCGILHRGKRYCYVRFF